MLSPESSFDEPLSHKTPMLGLKLWVVIGLVVVFSIVLILAFLTSMYIMIQNRRRLRKDVMISEKYRLPILHVPHVSKEIKVVGDQEMNVKGSKSSGRFLDPLVLFSGRRLKKNSYEDESRISIEKSNTVSSSFISSVDLHSPLMALPDQFSHLEWGHWFTLRELQLATNFFSDDHIIGDGGYGIVYKGDLINGTQVAIKKLHNHLGQAEKEFRVEVDAIGHVRHKNLVRLLGFCIEGTQRMLIYEYMKNGNLEQWLHGQKCSLGILDWEKRMKILLGTAKALAYLHEAIEPKVVHRDIKSSNILIDDDFNAKVSDFGLAKLLGSQNTHITTRVMGTFGYVAPEYAKTGLLNEKSDIYSFGVVLLETITGRDPVDYGRVAHEINLVEWLKTMIGSKRSEEVIDPRFEIRPSTKALKRALLAALRCLDPDYTKRPKMSQVVQMMESDDDQMTSRNDRSRAHSKNTNNAHKVTNEAPRVEHAGRRKYVSSRK